MDSDGASPVVEPRVLGRDNEAVRDFKFFRVRIRPDVEIPLSRILTLTAIGAFLFAVGWFSAAYKAELASDAGAVPRIEPYTAAHRETALQVLRISLETQTLPSDAFRIYQALVSEARTFDQQYREAWVEFAKNWRSGTLGELN